MKKLNERRTYDLGKNDVITYKKPSSPRKLNFMVLRGPGISGKKMVDENAEINAFMLKQSVKAKFYPCKDLEEAIRLIKDANTWAAAIVFNPGSLDPNADEMKRTLKKILIPVKKIDPSPEGSAETYIDALGELISKFRSGA